MGLKIKNNAYGVLSATLGDNAVTDTSITLGSGEGAKFPSLSTDDYFYATLVDTSNNVEIVKCTSITTDTLTVTRAQDDTTIRSWAIGARLEMRPIAKIIDDVNLTDVISSTGTTNAIDIDSAEHVTFTNEISTASTSLFEVDSTAGVDYFKLGELRTTSGTEVDGYAHITIYNAVDYGVDNATRVEIQVSQRNGVLTRYSSITGSAVANNNISVVVTSTDSTSPYDNLTVWLKADDAAKAFVTIVHRAGAAWNDRPTGTTLTGTVVWNSSTTYDTTVSTSAPASTDGENGYVWYQV